MTEAFKRGFMDKAAEFGLEKQAAGWLRSLLLGAPKKLPLVGEVVPKSFMDAMARNGRVVARTADRGSDAARAASGDVYSALRHAGLPDAEAAESSAELSRAVTRDFVEPTEENIAAAAKYHPERTEEYADMIAREYKDKVDDLVRARDKAGLPESTIIGLGPGKVRLAK